jgi:hypothetical protein
MLGSVRAVSARCWAAAYATAARRRPAERPRCAAAAGAQRGPAWLDGPGRLQGPADRVVLSQDRGGRKATDAKASCAGCGCKRRAKSWPCGPLTRWRATLACSAAPCRPSAATCGPTSSRSPAPTGRTGRWPSAPMSWPAGSGCGRPPRSSAAPANPAAVSQRKSTVQLARLAAGGPPRRSLTRCSPSSTRQRAPARGHTGTPAVRPPRAEEPETLGFGAGGRHEPRKPFPTAQRAPSRRAAPRRTRPPAARRAASRPARRQAERTERQTQARASRAERSSRPTIPTATNAEHPRLLAGPGVPCRACLRDLMLGLRSRRSAILPAES